MKVPFLKKGKNQGNVLHFGSEHLIAIIESFKKVRLRALEKAQETAEMVEELVK